ncbi:MAG: hypothetical protein AAF601_09370 [Pseudomonadota bacterium]
MGFFWRRRKKTAQIALVPVDRAAAVTAWRQLDSYRQLQLLIGQDKAAEVLVLCEAYIAESTHWRSFEDVAENLFANAVNSLLQHEMRMINNVLEQINRLWGQCDNSELREVLDRNALAPNDWRIPTNPLEDDLWKGMNWVCSHDPSREMRRHVLYLLMILQRDYDPRRKEAFERANRELIGATAANGDRRTMLGVPYPSSPGGRALFERIEVLATGLNLQPGSGEAKWDDLACFLYGAYIRAQGAADGNKRTSRAIFIATLRKGGRPIRVPNHAMDAILMGPNFVR